MSELIRNYVAGRWTLASGPATLPVTDPSSGEEIGRTPLSTRADIDAAVQAARAAFPMWRTTPAVERARVLRNNFV